MGVLEDVREQYPTLAFLLKDPEIGSLLRKAVDPSSQYSPARFQAELMQTQWWARRSQTAREADILFNTDRGTYNQNIKELSSQIRWRATQLGVALRPSEISWLANSMFRNGQTVDGPELAAALTKFRRSPGRQREGAIRTYATGARTLARSQYYLNMSGGSAQRWGEWIATGQKTEQDLQAYLQRMALSAYPHLKNSLKSGATMADIFSEHQNAVAEILNMDPNQVNLMDGKWRKITHYHDPKTREHRAMTIGEAQYYARQDPRFWHTPDGRQQDAAGANMILRLMGERA